MIRELTSYLATQLSLTVGVGIFAGYFPEDAQDTILVVLEPGAERQNFYLPGTFEKAIQIYTRAPDYQTASDLAASARDRISGKGNAVRTLPPLASGEPVFQINTAEALSGPAPMGMDERGRFQFSTNLLLRVQRA